MKQVLSNYQTARSLLKIAYINLSKINTSDGHPCWIYNAYKEHLIAEGEYIIEQVIQMGGAEIYKHTIAELKQKYFFQKQFLFTQNLQT